MPSYTYASTLVKMYYDCPGASWTSTWQDLSGVHYGLFPSDNACLPVGWTHQMAMDIATYFDKFHACKTEAEKMKFASQNKVAETVPSCKAWCDWLTDGWKFWKVHTKNFDFWLPKISTH